MKRSAYFRSIAYVYAALAAIAWLIGAPPLYPATVIIIATVYAVGSEILKELGR